MANPICLLFDMCRLCLDEPGAFDMFEDHILIQDILLCTGIPEIISMDELPRKICSACIYKIRAAKDLRQYSMKNDLYMKSLLDGNSNFGHKIARPRILLGLITPFGDAGIDTPLRDAGIVTPLGDAGIVTPVEEAVVRKPKISVRSLADINATPILQLCSSDKDETSRKTKLSESSSTEDIKTESNKKAENKCYSSTESIGTPENNKKIRISTGDCGEHKCDICQKVYSTSKKLYLHRRSHSKKLYCPIDACGKNFATKGDLQKHIRSHTGEKPYICDLCDKGFTQNVTLKSHKEVVHLEKT